MDNTHEIQLWSKLYRQEALERARIRALSKLAGGSVRARVALFRTKREAGASETRLTPTVRHGL